MRGSGNCLRVSLLVPVVVPVESSTPLSMKGERRGKETLSEAATARNRDFFIGATHTTRSGASPLEPRSDSKLTFQYGEGTTPLSATEVVHELLVVDWLHKHTAYGEKLPDLMRAVAKSVHETYAIEWGDTWK